MKRNEYITLITNESKKISDTSPLSKGKTRDPKYSDESGLSSRLRKCRGPLTL